MKGFNPKFKDFPDYIISITKEIWEDRGIATLHEYYGEDIVVRTPSTIAIGNQGVIGATMATLAEFPDRTLLGEDVIWSGNEEEGMLSSHRIYSTATHLGDGIFGKATGKQLKYRIIADCYAINNAITDEWLIRDQGAIVRQMGWDPKAFAVDQIEREGGPEKSNMPFTPAIDQPGPYKSKGNDNAWGQKYADILLRLMNADMATIPREYDRACHVAYPGGIEGISFAAIDNFWIGLRASFPNAKFTIEHQIGRNDPMMPPRAAIRFSLQGKHDGWGTFGQPTGKDVYIMGAAHVEFGPWGIRREYVLFDETAIWKQIALQTG
ncbi:polyketide cyclase [Marinomonas sp. S3726]|uniref:nuclear transport factor 2 family protein n=1 Tax=Marinomonas sp. S3726 TaxID=579484 RepID=UPI0005FA7C6B|nr:polyketide cyclase [Marinomonas sp. S3726]KJZ16053.1 polyketide cyclase [Marinomonas sp. S3726]